MSADELEHRPRRRFGQNFLVDSRWIETILDALAPGPGEPLVEVGPGRGALTGPLLDRGARVTALEIDRDLVRLLRESHGTRAGLRIVEGDALTVDLDALALEAAAPDPPPVRLVANLPYNVATPIVGRILETASIASAQVMVQDEVADRLTAGPGERGYGPLAVLCHLRGGARRLFRIGPAAFRPRPRVTSAVVRIRTGPDAMLAPAGVAPLRELLHRGFAERRKTLANNLRAGGVPREVVASALEARGLMARIRAEDVPPEAWPGLHAALGRLSCAG